MKNWGYALAADRYIQFDSRGYANAFVEGVEYANDSSLNVIGVFLVPNNIKEHTPNYYVHIVDDDKNEDESDDLPENWDNRRGNIS